LPQDEAQERTTLLRDVAEAVLIGRRIESRGQADIAHDMLAVVEAADGAQHGDGGQRGQGANAGMRDQTRRMRSLTPAGSTPIRRSPGRPWPPMEGRPLQRSGAWRSWRG
jgi:hypothetical protein